MPKLILGPLQSGKTTYILNDIKKRMENGCENMIILVPEQSTMSARCSAFWATGRAPTWRS